MVDKPFTIWFNNDADRKAIQLADIKAAINDITDQGIERDKQKRHGYHGAPYKIGNGGSCSRADICSELFSTNGDKNRPVTTCESKNEYE